MDPTDRLRRVLARAALFGCVLMAAIIVTSAFLRLKSIGIGCDEWPQCYARVVVATPAAQSVLTPVAIARLLHRVSAMAVALLAAFVLMLTLARAARNATNLVLSVGLCLLTVVLAVVGRQTAGSVVPLVGLVNLAGGFAMLTMFWLLWLRNRPAASGTGAGPGRTALVYAACALIAVQAAIGALVSVSYSAFACEGLLGCGTGLSAVPAALTGFDPAQPLALDSANRVQAPPGAAELQLLHRITGLALAGALVLLGAWLARFSARRKLGICLVAAASAELGLGIAMVLGEFPLSAALLHNFAAASLLVVCVSIAAAAHAGMSS
ncbi:MAG: hypothetical protein EHM59_11345 [Betaproteobacteria bacterium]|nr:MAG: hypothetical protein EHM59_11345 [Betaproteobacteria bacterium]